jgi:hypothetical protein
LAHAARPWAAALARTGVEAAAVAVAETAVRAALETIVMVVARRLRGAGTLSVSAAHRIGLSDGG